MLSCLRGLGTRKLQIHFAADFFLWYRPATTPVECFQKERSAFLKVKYWWKQYLYLSRLLKNPIPVCLVEQVHSAQQEKNNWLKHPQIDQLMFLPKVHKHSCLMHP